MKRLIAFLLLVFCAQAQAGLQDIVLKGATDRSVTVDIIDSTTGLPETGVVFDTSGIDLWYRREGAAKVAITEATLAALTTAHTDGGFLHVENGTYRLDLPDAAFATGANYVDFGGTVTDMVVIGGRVRLVNFDPETATQDVNVTSMAANTLTASALAADAASEIVLAMLAASVGPRTFECVLKALEAVSYGEFAGAATSRTFRSPENDGVTVTGTQSSEERVSSVTCP